MELSEFQRIACQVVFIFASMLLIILGLTGIFAWHFHIMSILQIRSGFVPMVYNTALSFVAFGIACLAIRFQFIYIARIIVFLLALLAILTLLEYLLGVNFKIDQFLLKDYLTVIFFPGRMALNTAVCFILASISLWLLIKPCIKIPVIIGGCLGIIIGSLAISFLFGYFLNIPSIDIWGVSKPMSFYTGVGILILSIALCALSIYRSILLRIEITPYMPPIATFSVIMGTLLYWHALRFLEINPDIYWVDEATLLIGFCMAILLGLSLHFGMSTWRKTKFLEETLSLEKAILEATNDAILAVDLHRKILGYNKKFLAMAHVPETIIKAGDANKAIDLVLNEVKDPKKFLEDIEKEEKNPELATVAEIQFKDGSIVERYSQPKIMHKKIVGQVFSFRDVTQAKHLEQQLREQATHDSLTKLPNQVLLLDRLEQAITHAQRFNEVVGVLFINLKRFKSINNLLGRALGDALLIEVSSRLKKIARNQDTLSRFEADEFVLLVGALKDEAEIIPIINRSLNAFKQSFLIHDQTISIDCDIGVSFYPKDGEKAGVLLKAADLAMSRTKKESGSTFQFSTAKLQQQMQSQLEIEKDLYHALEKKELRLFYQPIVDARINKVVGVEALLRWQHPTKGLLLPGEFIAIAEDTGLIIPIGEWVLRTACQQAKLWQQQGLPPVLMSVNLSRQQLKQKNFLETIENVLQETAMSPDNLQLELLESVLFEFSKQISSIINELKAMDIHIAIDDFGTGYSSLSYLRHFMVDELKIDRSFIKNIVDNEQDRAIVQAIIALAKILKMRVLVEGVETEQQLHILLTMGCYLIQGFYYSRPLPSDELLNFIKNQ